MEGHGPCYLTIEAGELGEDVGVDEAQLGLNLVAAQIVDRGAILIQNQVLCVRPEPRKKQPIITVSVRESPYLRKRTADNKPYGDGQTQLCHLP